MDSMTMSMPEVSVTALLENLKFGEDPFAVLSSILHLELYGLAPSVELLRASIAFTIVLGLCLLGSVVGLAIKIRGGDRKLYRWSDSGYLQPNVLLNWLLWNIVFIAFTFPFIWVGSFKSGDLTNNPLWSCLVFIPLFFGLWHVAFGTAISALQQNTRTNSSTFFPFIVNSMFLGGLVTANISMLIVTLMGIQKWNIGIRNYNLLNSLLVNSIGTTGGEGGARTVLMQIPNADFYLLNMATSLTHFELSFGVCVFYAATSAFIMLLAGSYQIKTLLHQIKLLKSAVKATESTTKLESLPSINSSLLSNFDRRRALIRMMRTVLIITVTITLSMVLYCFVCISKKLNAPRSAIFHIYESAMGHLYVILFIYSTLDAIIVGLILFQSFDASTTREKAALSYADSATSSDSTKSSSSFGSMEKRLSLLAPTSSAIILSKTDVKNIVIEDPMVLPPIYSPRNSVIRVGKRESISSIRSISRVSVPVWEGDLAKSAVVEY